MGEIKNKYILNLEAKDLWLTNHYKKGVGTGYNIYKRDGSLNFKKFDGTFDDSLDWDKLNKIYWAVYRHKGLVIRHHNKEYTKSVINVNFTYSVKEYNQISYVNIKEQKNRAAVYVKVGYDYNDLSFVDGVAIVDDEIAGIIVNLPVENPIDNDKLGRCFVYADGVYKIKSLKTLVSVEDLRHWIYNEGFMCDSRKYIRFKRSNGSSRIGKCLFIDEQLYPLMNKWQRCGIKPDEYENFDLAAYEAYIGLTLSSIIGKVKIRPENILVIDDYTSVFTERMIVTRDVDGELQSNIEEHEVHNAIWDGQSLMDSSLFEGFEQYGMLLLRNRFFKSCCFNTNIQKWFEDNGITEVKQLNGFTMASSVKEIKLITTPNSIKYLKFGKLSRWLRTIDEDFGIVKHEKPPHNFGGKLVHTHYQLINTLQLTEKEVTELVAPSAKLLHDMDECPAVLKTFIGCVVKDEPMRDFSTKNSMVHSLMGITDEFCKTKLYHEFKFDLINSIKSDMRRGRILVNGNYSVLFGNPVEMLQYVIGKFDGTSQLGRETIYSKRFCFGKTILGSRSPHVCASNIYLATNKQNDEIERYFNLSEQIVAVNSIGETLLDRFSGSDFDSDTCLLTDNEVLIRAAKKNYDKFLVPTSAVQATKKVRHYTADDLADLDVKTSNNKIGEIINLAQILTTKFYTNISNGQTFEENQGLYSDIITLDILSGVEIDKAKREFEVDTAKELNKLRIKWLSRDSRQRTIIPKFLGFIAKKKGYYNSDKKNYTYHKSSMEYVQQAVHRIRFNRPTEYMPLSGLLKGNDFNESSANYKQRNMVVSLLRSYMSAKKSLWANDGLTSNQKTIRQDELYRDLLKKIRAMRYNINTMKLLLKTCESGKYKDCQRQLFYLIFSALSRNMYRALDSSKSVVQSLEENPDGNIIIFETRYSVR